MMLIIGLIRVFHVLWSVHFFLECGPQGIRINLLGGDWVVSRRIKKKLQQASVDWFGKLLNMIYENK